MDAERDRQDWLTALAAVRLCLKPRDLPERAEEVAALMPETMDEARTLISNLARLCAVYISDEANMLHITTDELLDRHMEWTIRETPWTPSA